jgi:hypothetical protein
LYLLLEGEKDAEILLFDYNLVGYQTKVIAWSTDKVVLHFYGRDEISMHSFSTENTYPVIIIIISHDLSFITNYTSACKSEVQNSCHVR